MGTEGAAGWSTFVGTNTGTVLAILKCLLLYSTQAKFKKRNNRVLTRFREKIKPVENILKLQKKLRQ
jgi:hypothetical protein